MAGVIYYFLGIETRGKSIEEIDKELTSPVRMTAMAQMSRLNR
jgi:putative MFS transporter